MMAGGDGLLETGTEGRGGCERATGVAGVGELVRMNLLELLDCSQCCTLTGILAYHVSKIMIWYHS